MWYGRSVSILRSNKVKRTEHSNVTGGEWRLKYERAIREIEFTKKRLQQESDDKLEVEQQNKRQLERRVSAHPAFGPIMYCTITWWECCLWYHIHLYQKICFIATQILYVPPTDFQKFKRTPISVSQSMKDSSRNHLVRLLIQILRSSVLWSDNKCTTQSFLKTHNSTIDKEEKLNVNI